MATAVHGRAHVSMLPTAEQISVVKPKQRLFDLLQAMLPTPSAACLRRRASRATDGTLPHKSKEAGNLTCVLSGLVCGIQIFVFCCVFSDMLFGQNQVLATAVPLGVGMQTMTTMVSTLAFARYSGCPAVVAAPDINPIVFLAEAAKAVSSQLCPGGDWSECTDAAPKAVPTVLASTLIATSLVGLSFFLLGKFRLSVIVGFIPSSLTSGFLSCVGCAVQ